MLGEILWVRNLMFVNINVELIRVVDGDTIDCYIDLGFNIRIKNRVRYMGIDTWESRTRDLEEKEKGLIIKTRKQRVIGTRSI